MKLTTVLVAVAAAIALFVGFYMIEIDQTQEATLPDVSIEGGQLPEFDADVGDIEVTEETVTVPSIEVTPPREDG